MKEKIKLIEQILGKDRVKENEPLKYHNAKESSGNAECFYIATNLKELEQALNLAHELKIPFYLIGSGTKMIISEDGLSGFVIKNRTSGIKISGVKGKVSAKGIGVDEALVEVESGVSLGKINEFLKQQGLAQLDFPFIANETLGGSLYISPALAGMAQKVKVFSEAQVFDIDILELKRADFILSAILKVKSAS